MFLKYDNLENLIEPILLKRKEEFLKIKEDYLQKKAEEEE